MEDYAKHVEQILAAIGELSDKINETKPNDRSERDRRHAIMRTKLEDVAAWAVYLYALENGAFYEEKQDGSE